MEELIDHVSIWTPRNEGYVVTKNSFQRDDIIRKITTNYTKTIAGRLRSEKKRTL